MADINSVADFVARMYYGGDLDAGAGLEIIDFVGAVRSARAYKIRTDYWTNYKQTGERIISNSWLRSYPNVAVTLNPDTQQYYSVLPTSIYDLTYGLGLYQICPMQNMADPFKPMTIGENFLFRKNPTDNITYHYDHENVYYDQFDPKYEKSGVFMQLIPLNDDDIPDEFVFEIRELTLNHFLKVKSIPQDKSSDNNPNVFPNERATVNQNIG